MSANYNNTFVIATGSRQNDIDEASTPIDDVIDMLREAKRQGAEHVTLGPYLPARFMVMYPEGDMASDLYAPLDEDPNA